MPDGVRAVMTVAPESGRRWDWESYGRGKWVGRTRRMCRRLGGREAGIGGEGEEERGTREGGSILKSREGDG